MITGRDLDNRDAGARPVDAPAGAHASPSELAAQWGVPVQAVYRDIGKGALRAFRLPKGRIRIRLSDAARHGRPDR